VCGAGHGAKGPGTWGRAFWAAIDTLRARAATHPHAHCRLGLPSPPPRPGTIALSGNLIEALDALFMARIPEAWLKTSWEAATLGGWFAGLLQVGVRGVTSPHRWRAGQREVHTMLPQPALKPPATRPSTPQRHDQLAKWLTTGRPRAYWLTGFFNPQVRALRARDRCWNPRGRSPLQDMP
jgi:hypothetical protein